MKSLNIDYDYTGHGDRSGEITNNGEVIYSWSYDKKQSKCICDVVLATRKIKFIYRNSGVQIFKAVKAMIESGEVIHDNIQEVRDEINAEYFNTILHK